MSQSDVVPVNDVDERAQGDLNGKNKVLEN
jgi:hypothetical protein